MAMHRFKSLLLTGAASLFCASVALPGIIDMSAIAADDAIDIKQTEQAQATLSLRDILALARGNDQRIIAARYDLDAAGYEAQELTAGSRPRLTAHGYATNKYDDDPFRRDGEFYSAGLEGRQTVLSFGRNKAAREEGRAAINLGTHNYRLAEHDVTIETLYAYGDYLRAQEAYLIWQKNLGTLKDRLTNAETKIQHQVGPISEYRDVKARYNKARAGYLSAQANQRDARRTLFILLGIEDKGQTIQSWPRGLMTSDQTFNTDRLVQFALEHSPSVLLAYAEQEKLAAQLEGAKAQLRPSLELLARADTGSIDGTDTSSTEIGVTGSMPLYQGGALRARVKKLQASYAAATNRTIYAERRLEVDVNNQLNNLNAGIAALSEWTNVIVERRQGIAELGREVEQGLRTVDVLYNLEEDVVEDEIAVIDNRIDTVMACFDLLYMTGAITSSHALACPDLVLKDQDDVRARSARDVADGIRPATSAPTVTPAAVPGAPAADPAIEAPLHEADAAPAPAPAQQTQTATEETPIAAVIRHDITR